MSLLSPRRMVSGKWFLLALLLALVGSLLGTATLSEAQVTSAQAVPPDQPGPHHVGYYSAAYYVSPYGWYTATIRYPAIRDGWRAPLDRSNAYPGIVVTDGFLTTRYMIDWIPQHLVSHGYIALCFTTPNPASVDAKQWAFGFSGGIDKLLNENKSILSPIRGLLKENSGFGIIGLSMGGAGVVEAAASNSHVKAAVALAPGSVNPVPIEQAAMKITVPIQFQVGTNDRVIPTSVLHYYSLVPNATAKDYVEIVGGNHVGFADEWAAQLAYSLGIDGPCTIGFDKQHQLAAGNFTRWFETYLP